MPEKPAFALIVIAQGNAAMGNEGIGAGSIRSELWPLPLMHPVGEAMGG